MNQSPNFSSVSRIPYPLSRKIKIAQVITRMDWGGAPDIIRILCGYLNKELYDIKLITGVTRYPSKKTKAFLEAYNDNITFIPELTRDINPVKDLSAFIQLYALFRRERFDVVHTHTAKAGILARLAARCAGIHRVIHTAHGHTFYGYFGPVGSVMTVWLEKFAAKFSSKLTALTELEKQDMIHFKICPPEKINVVTSGLELKEYRDAAARPVEKISGLALGERECLVGMISRLEPVKGPEYFIKAAKLVIEKFPKTKFLVVGEGSLKRTLKILVRQLGIEDAFTFAGWREDVPQILTGLDILVQPSLNEAVGRILIEAAACGIPVVATEAGGIPEIVKHNETGILVKPASVDCLAGAIAALLESKEKRNKMGRSAKVWADDKFSAQRMTNEISALYQELMAHENT